MKAEMEVVKTQVELKKFSNDGIYLKPLGLVFFGKDKNGKAKRFLFQNSEVERYTPS